MSTQKKIQVGLFVTCLVNLFRPTIAFASIKLLEDAGCSVDVPLQQTCCGQPAYNSGDQKNARYIAKQVIKSFENYDYVVAPSGSCASMIKKHYPALLANNANWSSRAETLAQKTYELTSFLTDVLKITQVSSPCQGSAAYHDSCSGLRELGIKSQPRDLLQSIEGLTLQDLPDSDVCCGFGGTFCVKYSDISNAIVGRKTAKIAETSADLLLAGDLGCLMNIAGKLEREGSSVQVRHVAEVLAGMMDTPPIAKPQDQKLS